MSRAAGGKKFSKLDVKRVYFGNWLRDYSQAVDVGTVKYVSAEAIRLILWVLGFMVCWGPPWSSLSSDGSS